MTEPIYTYTFPPRGGLPALEDLESLVPGAMVYANVQSGSRPGTWRGRWRKLSQVEQTMAVNIIVTVPLHGAWLVAAVLQQWGVDARSSQSGNLPSPTSWPRGAEWLQHLEDAGREAIQNEIDAGMVKPHVADIATPYQARVVEWTRTRPWVLLGWACGSGKTLGALLAVLSRSTRSDTILVVCPAKARHVWWSQVQEYSHVVPYRLRPASDMRKSDQTLADYMQQERDTPRLVIVGAESLADTMPRIEKITPTILIWDELHIHGSAKRWKATQQADGSVSFSKRKTSTAAQDRVTRAVAAMEVSRLPGLRLRIGATATLLEDGRPRRLWAPLDLLSPGGFSHSYRSFAARHCNAKAGPFGWDDSGSSNLDELRHRCSFFMHEVPYSESHDALPSTRVQVCYLGRNELNRADRFSDGQTYTQALRSMARDDMKTRLGRTRMIEARLAEACSKKRRWVTEQVLDGLRGGGKVVVFTARRIEAENWADSIRREATRGDNQMSQAPRVWMVHGGLNESDKDRIIDMYACDPGPCCLVATGQSVGTGVDGMQTTDLAIFAMLPWKPGDFVQWKGRFDRLGGRATLLQVPIAEGTYDTRVVEILTDKFGPIQQMLAADELEGLTDKLLGMEDTEGIIASIIDKLT